MKSEENPANCATRSLTSSQRLAFKLLWEGPQSLITENLINNQRRQTNTTSVDIKTKCYLTMRKHKCTVMPTLFNTSISEGITRSANISQL